MGKNELNNSTKQDLVDFSTKEAQLVWNRYGCMVVANSILLGFIGQLAIKEHPFGMLEILACFMGLLIALMWLFITSYGWHLSWYALCQSDSEELKVYNQWKRNVWKKLPAGPIWFFAHGVIFAFCLAYVLLTLHFSKCWLWPVVFVIALFVALLFWFKCVFEIARDRSCQEVKGVKVKTDNSKAASRLTVIVTVLSLGTAMIATIAAFISAHYAGVAVSYSAPWERPIMIHVNSEGSIVEGGILKGEIVRGEFISVTILLKNIGRRPAENITVSTWYAPSDELNNVRMGGVEKRTNVLQSEQMYTAWITIGRKPAQSQKFSKTIFLHYDISYADAFSHEEMEPLTLYLKYSRGDKVEWEEATVEERDTFQSNLKKAKAAMIESADK